MLPIDAHPRMKPVILTLAISTLLSSGIAQEGVSVTGADITEVGIYTARIGTRFGFRYTIRGTPSNAPIVLRMVGEHPPYTNPRTGKTQTRDEYELKSWIGETYTSYLFEEEWELIPGKFKFEVWHRDKKLCEQSFTVVPDPKPKGTP